MNAIIEEKLDFCSLLLRKTKGRYSKDLDDKTHSLCGVAGRTVSLDHPHRLVSHPKRVEAHQSPRQNNLRAGGNNNSNAVDDAQKKNRREKVFCDREVLPDETDNPVCLSVANKLSRSDCKSTWPVPEFSNTLLRVCSSTSTTSTLHQPHHSPHPVPDALYCRSVVSLSDLSDNDGVLDVTALCKDSHTRYVTPSSHRHECDLDPAGLLCASKRTTTEFTDSIKKCVGYHAKKDVKPQCLKGSKPVRQSVAQKKKVTHSTCGRHTSMDPLSVVMSNNAVTQSLLPSCSRCSIDRRKMPPHDRSTKHCHVLAQTTSCCENIESCASTTASRQCKPVHQLSARKEQKRVSKTNNDHELFSIVIEKKPKSRRLPCQLHTLSTLLILRHFSWAWDMTSASSTTIVRSFLRDAFTRLRVHAKTALFRAEQAMLSDERRRCVALIAQQDVLYSKLSTLTDRYAKEKQELLKAQEQAHEEAQQLWCSKQSLLMKEKEDVVKTLTEERAAHIEKEQKAQQLGEKYVLAKNVLKKERLKTQAVATSLHHVNQILAQYRERVMMAEEDHESLHMRMVEKSRTADALLKTKDALIENLRLGIQTTLQQNATLSSTLSSTQTELMELKNRLVSHTMLRLLLQQDTQITLLTCKLQSKTEELESLQESFSTLQKECSQHVVEQQRLVRQLREDNASLLGCMSKFIETLAGVSAERERGLGLTTPARREDFAVYRNSFVVCGICSPSTADSVKMKATEMELRKRVVVLEEELQRQINANVAVRLELEEEIAALKSRHRVQRSDIASADVSVLSSQALDAYSVPPESTSVLQLITPRHFLSPVSDGQSDQTISTLNFCSADAELGCNVIKRPLGSERCASLGAIDLCREPLLQDADGFLSSCSKEHAVSDSSTFSLSSDVSTTKAFSRRSSDGDEKRQLYGTETVVTNNIVEDVDEGDNDRHTWRRNENPKIEELHDLKNPGNGYARTHCSKNGCFSQVRAPDASCQKPTHTLLFLRKQAQRRSQLRCSRGTKRVVRLPRYRRDRWKTESHQLTQLLPSEAELCRGGIANKLSENTALVLLKTSKNKNENTQDPKLPMQEECYDMENKLCAGETITERVNCLKNLLERYSSQCRMAYADLHHQTQRFDDIAQELQSYNSPSAYRGLKDLERAHALRRTLAGCRWVLETAHTEREEAAKRRFKVLLDLEKLEQRNAQREFVGQELDNRTGRP